MMVLTIGRIRTTKKLFVRGFTYHPVKSSSSSSSSFIFQTGGFCRVSNKKSHPHQKYHRWLSPTLPCSRSENENEGSSSSAEEKDYNNDDDDNRALVRDVVESILLKTSLIATATATRTSSSPPPPPPPKNNNSTNDVNNDDADIVVPFQRLFQSTLQRAYSTTTATTRTRTSSSVATTTTTTMPIIIPPTVSNSNNSTNSRYSSSSSSSTVINETNQKESSFPASSIPASSSSLSEQNQNAPPPPPPPAKQQQQQQQQNAYAYRSNPAFQTIALAHLLWGTIIRPNVDTVIDATCGQGYDSIKLAELLFLNTNHNHNNGNGSDTSTTSTTTCHSELLCLDIQPLACEKTRHALREVLPSSIGISSVTNSNNSNNNNNYNNNNMDCISKDTDDEDVTNNKVRIIETSHEILPRPRNISSVGLIVYNLGWLPGVVGSSVDANKDGNNNKDCVTTTETTISSLVDATSMIRNGGMISIATYPATNVEEDSAVKLFVTCLALLTSNIRTWEEAIISFVETTSTTTGTTSEEDDDNNDNNDNNLLAIRENDIALVVYRAMEKIVDQRQYSNNPKSTWRVAQHEKLGMDCAPILYTATRIK
jgi:hypothetical protein